MIDPDEFFREVTLRISSTLEIDRALAQLRDYLASWLAVDSIRLIYYDEAARGVISFAGAGPGGVSFGRARHDRFFATLSLGAFHRLMETLQFEQTRARIFAPNTMPLPPDLDFVPRIIPEVDRLRSALMLGLSMQPEQEVGGLLLTSEQDEAFGEEHCRLLESVRTPIAIAASNARRFHELTRLHELLDADNRQMRQELSRLTTVEVVGGEDGLAGVMGAVRRVAPTASAVLLQGETGTGKEVIANALHQLSPRASGPLVRVHCGGIPETLLDSELFGHEKGAFTGADRRKPGRFERAHQGTIFLDEIGELTPEAQVRLLRVLQEREFERVGGTETVSVDVRVIVATHRDLQAMVAAGTFREDLYFRLAVFPILIPPLRQRRQDIPALARYFVARKAAELNRRPAPVLGEAEIARLQGYAWPGNVRELQNVIERALIVGTGRELRLPELSLDPPLPHLPELPGPTSPVQPLDQLVADHLRRALRITGGRIEGPGGAADLLGLNPSTLRARLRKLGVPFGRGTRSEERGTRG